MSAAIFELHERYPNEVIGEADHAVVHEEFTLINMGQICFIDGVKYRLPRGSYFGDSASAASIRTEWNNVQHRLNRSASVFVTTAAGSFGYGLRVVASVSPLLKGIAAPPQRQKTSAASLLSIIGEQPGPHTSLSALLPVKKAQR